ncbi:MAG: hypothetical protein ACYDD0_09630 [Candidatus Dormibacteria bacterium]
MNRFWPPREASQTDYERVRQQVLLGSDEVDLAAVRFRRSGLAGLIIHPPTELLLVATVVGGQRPRWSGLEDPRGDALAATFTLLAQVADRDQPLVPSGSMVAVAGRQR